MTHLTVRATDRQATNRYGEIARPCQVLLILIGIAREINDLLYDVLTVHPRGDTTKARSFRARPSRKRHRITSRWRRSSQYLQPLHLQEAAWLLAEKVRRLYVAALRNANTGGNAQLVQVFSGICRERSRNRRDRGLC